MWELKVWFKRILNMESIQGKGEAGVKPTVGHLKWILLIPRDGAPSDWTYAWKWLRRKLATTKNTIWTWTSTMKSRVYIYTSIYTYIYIHRARERVREKISQIPILTTMNVQCYSTPVLFWIPVCTARNYARSRHKRASAEFVESCLGGGSTPAAKPMAFRPA